MKIKNSRSRNLNELALLVSDQITAMLAYWDSNLICRFANNAYIKWFGKSKEEMIDKIHISELLGPLFEKNLPYIQAALSGKNQVFERDIPIPGGDELRHSLATYIPDFQNSEVIGFFVHVADVTYIKKLEKEIGNVKRKMLKNTILTQEKERRYVVEVLRESINQRLVGCRMMAEKIKKDDLNSINEIKLYLSEVVHEINEMCQELTPTEIETFGIIPALEIVSEKYFTPSSKKFLLKCEGKSLEDINLNDKVSIFRIVQSFVKLTAVSKECKKVQILINYEKPRIHIQLISSNGTQLDVDSKEYRTIESRVDYFAGQIIHSKINKENSIDIQFLIQDE